MTWVDNYNAKWRLKMNNISKESYSLANWTGIAVRAYTGAQIIDLRVRRDGEDKIVPALPDNPWDQIRSVTELIIRNTQLPINGVEQFGHIAPISVQGMEHMKHLFEKSLMVQWEVDRVPLKPNPHSRNLPDQYKDAIRQAPDTLANFYPKGVFPHNIGSNEGIVWFLKRYYEDFIQNNAEPKYIVITCDENIYKRAIRVLLSLPFLRKLFVVPAYMLSLNVKFLIAFSRLKKTIPI